VGGNRRRALPSSLAQAAVPAVILSEVSNANEAKDLGQLRASEAGTGSCGPESWVALFFSLNF
jgi:hypothetical protein